MRYRYLDDFRRGISVFAIFSYGIAVLGTPQCPPRPSFNIPLAVHVVYSSHGEGTLCRAVSLALPTHDRAQNNNASKTRISRLGEFCFFQFISLF